jgi:hypothetical protein
MEMAKGKKTDQIRMISSILAKKTFSFHSGGQNGYQSPLLEETNEIY